jgi:hypothetical protein
MRNRLRLLAGLALHVPLTFAATESKGAPDPGFLEFLGTFDERDQGDEWFKFLEGMRPNRSQASPASPPELPTEEDGDEPQATE